MPPGAPPGWPAAGGPGNFGNATAGMPLASWGTRAAGWLIDAALIIVPYLVVGLGLGRVSVFFSFIAFVYALAAGIWFAVQVGSSGQSPGMRVMGLQCLSTKTGATIGGGMGFVRSLAHSVCSILCGIGAIIDLLFPLWDAQKQTLADKIMSTVVVTVPKKPFSITP